MPMSKIILGNKIKLYRNIDGKNFVNTMSDEELREIGRLKGKIIAKMAKSTVNDLKKQMEDLSKQLEGGLEGFMEEINNEENN